MNPSTELSMKNIKKHLIALIYVVVIILLFVKWVSFWGYKFSLIGLYAEKDEPIYLLGLIVSGLSCLYSLLRSETGGKKFELPIGFIITALFSVFFMIVINSENSDWGPLGPQLTAAPTAELILCAVGAVSSLIGESENKIEAKLIVPANPIAIKPHPFGASPAVMKSNDNSRKKCVSCGADIDIDSVFCPVCGHDTRTSAPHVERYVNPEKRTITCVNCGKVVEEGTKFCPFCGTDPMQLKSDEIIEQKSRIKSKGFSAPTDLD